MAETFFLDKCDFGLLRAPRANDAAGLGLADADHVQDGTVGRADERAGTALDAVHDAVLLAVVEAVEFGIGVEAVRLEAHGAGFDALAAAQAVGNLAAGGLFFTQEQ